MRALLSVHDKSGLPELARGLTELGWELIASGGTARALADAGIPHSEVERITAIDHSNIRYQLTTARDDADDIVVKQ